MLIVWGPTDPTIVCVKNNSSNNSITYFFFSSDLINTKYVEKHCDTSLYHNLNFTFDGNIKQK